MKTRIGTVGAALATALLVGSFYAATSAGAEPKVEVSKPARDLAGADNGFGLKLFKQLHKEGQNTFISPTSIAIAMQMARQAAAGDTRDEMDASMGLGALDVPVANKELIAALNARKGVKLAIANSLWADPKRVTMNEEYVREVADYFDSEARTADFDDPKTVDVINGWISDKTNKLIPNMLDEIKPDSIAYLINAIYFKGDWTEKFEKKDTKEADFYLADGSTRKVQMMSRTDDITYGEDKTAQFAKLPYGEDEQSAMWIILPREDTSLDSMVSELDSAKLNQWQNNAWEREGTLKLPRFKLRYKETLNDGLKAMGIVKAFDPEKSDFTRMGETEFNKVYISRVLHEAVVIVNEEGTEAAAATIVEMGCGAASRGHQPLPFKMTCDRPFLFVVTDEPTGAILFIGTCHTPENPD